MATSLYKISEQAVRILGKGEPQEIIELVKQAYATVAKLQFYESKNADDGSLPGSFIYTFKDQSPIKDTDLDLWYITIPSTYLELPYSMGINQVSYMKGQQTPFVPLNTGSTGLYYGLKAECLGGNDTYYVENTRMYLPTITESHPLLLKLAIALDEVDVYESLNIAPNIIDAILNIVIEKYSPKEVKTPDNL